MTWQELWWSLRRNCEDSMGSIKTWLLTAFWATSKHQTTNNWANAWSLKNYKVQCCWKYCDVLLRSFPSTVTSVLCHATVYTDGLGFHSSKSVIAQQCR
jgi:hypothetical protein